MIEDSKDRKFLISFLPTYEGQILEEGELRKASAMIKLIEEDASRRGESFEERLVGCIETALKKKNSRLGWLYR